jgi:hypothetical protein
MAAYGEIPMAAVKRKEPLERLEEEQWSKPTGDDASATAIQL